MDKDNNYLPKPVNTSMVEIPDTLKPLAEEMARNVHEVWAQNRIKEGWKYGPKRNDETKEHPCLVPYDHLPESEKEYDRATSRETLKLILQLGFDIVKKPGGEYEKIDSLCRTKEKELINKYFGGIDHEAAFKRPETIGEYPKDLPAKIEAEYKDFLEGLWSQLQSGKAEIEPLSWRKETLVNKLSEQDRELLEEAHRKAEEITLWERLSQTNHKDVTYYKALLREYTRDLLTVVRLEFIESLKKANYVPVQQSAPLQ